MQISQKKIIYPIGEAFDEYLKQYGRQANITTLYDDLCRFNGSMVYENPQGKETLWITVMYNQEDAKRLRKQLLVIYTQLRIGEESSTEHLRVDRIDFGEFGNSKPFRVRINNMFNDNADYFYVKQADASRILGLELEHILSPHRMNYLYKDNTLIEEHIPGVPGDVFIKDYLSDPNLNHVRISKEFIKFNERCWIRLLGDMRPVNYVVDITPDFEEIQYRVRPIDFDQQCYEGERDIYRAYRWDENLPIQDLVFKYLNHETIVQYQDEERTQLARRALSEKRRLTRLMLAVQDCEISPKRKVDQVRDWLSQRYNYYPEMFNGCDTMGKVLAVRLRHIIENHR